MESLQPVNILSRILAQLQRGEVQIPAVPDVVTQLRELVSKGDAKVEQLVALLEHDPALVARVLQLGRSASFGRGGQTPDLNFIINRVGFRQLASVVETVWANGCFKVADARYEPYVARLTRQALARAVAMRGLAERLRVEVFPAYLAGMFADVGASFLLWAIVDKARGRVPEPHDALAFVREHHEAMSGAVLKRWGHSELVIGLVRKHHAPALTGASGTHATLLVLAAQMAFELTGEEDLTTAEPWPSPALLERCETQIPLSEEVRWTLMEKLRLEYAEAIGSLI